MRAFKKLKLEEGIIWSDIKPKILLLPMANNISCRRSNTADQSRIMNSDRYCNYKYTRNVLYMCLNWLVKSWVYFEPVLVHLSNTVKTNVSVELFSLFIFKCRFKVFYKNQWTFLSLLFFNINFHIFHILLLTVYNSIHILTTSSASFPKKKVQQAVASVSCSWHDYAFTTTFN